MRERCRSNLSENSGKYFVRHPEGAYVDHDAGLYHDGNHDRPVHDVDHASGSRSSAQRNSLFEALRDIKVSNSGTEIAATAVFYTEIAATTVFYTERRPN